jgi:5-methyltetrahydrofolate--homocysteine methyltransferase
VSKHNIEELSSQRVLIIDGATGTQIQAKSELILDAMWEGKEGCNELLNVTAPTIMKEIHTAYAMAGANLIKTNTFGAFEWVLEEYDIADRAYELSKAGAKIVREVCDEFDSPEQPRFVLGSIGPGTKLPSLGHIEYDRMVAGYEECALGLIDGGVDVFLIETAQDPLQIKACIHGIETANGKREVKLPIMVSATIELSGTMLIGTDASTLATILEPFEILSLGFNCGTGPEQVKKHVQTLSEESSFKISVHANAGLPQNRGGYTFYPMGPDEFASIQESFLDFDGVSFLGGCCGTTPQHINALAKKVSGREPKKASGGKPTSIASLFESTPLKQEIPPLLIGERSNATGSKAFRELLLAEDYEGTQSVANEQVRAGAHVLDVSVGWAGRDERKDMQEVVSRYASNLNLPLMPDSTQTYALETALKLIGGKPIINSVNLEDGIEKFDEICQLAKKFGTSLVCLTIDEEGMAKTIERKVTIADRIYDRAVNYHGLKPSDLIFDLLTFTIGSGDEEYYDAALNVIEALKILHDKYPEVGSTSGLSNVSFGLHKDARPYLNSVFLHHCVEAGMSSAIVNVKHLIPYHKLSDEEKQVCEDLIFNRRDDGHDPLVAFIKFFENAEAKPEQSDEEFEALSDEEKIKKLLLDGDKERMLPLVLEAKDRLDPSVIVNEILLDGMKYIGELFGSGQMQLPFVLQSAETMKATVDTLNPYLPKSTKKSKTTLVLGTVKGDVHDVGKNLVDIILSNNGFDVVNIGIKVGIEDFITAYKEHNADAIGMSGLLVKSTLEMKLNLERLQEEGITVPVILGGAALSKKFVDEFCRPIYDGPIIYARDAFDGIEAMNRIEKSEGDVSKIDVQMAADLKDVDESKVVKKEVAKLPEYSEIKMPKVVNTPNPPFWGRRVISDTFDKKIAFDWINHKMLFKQRWGYKSKGTSKEEYEKLLDSEIYPAYERLKKQFIDEELFDPIVIYGYFKVTTDENRLTIYHDNEQYTLDLPRQGRNPYRCLSDYYKKEGDVIALTIVSAGLKLSEYESKLYADGEFAEYYKVHGLGVELAEALAEVVHKQIRLDLNIAQNEGNTLRDVQMNRYQGARYSFGYPACPNLEDNKIIFELLKPEEFGIELSETFQMHPEQTTSAIVAYHPEAIYFNI